ncbi:MAG: hydantoinase/oxoprolinase family protein [Gammaproteobacteria bacterium]
METGNKRVSVDVGGTFTDCLVMDENGELKQYKSPTTPDDPAEGVIHALTKAATDHGRSIEAFLSTIDILVHGTTLATNTLLTSKGARTGMLTTGDFRDILEIRRGIKPVHISLYNVFIPPNRPLVPRSRRLGVSERTLYTGEITGPLNGQEVAAAVTKLKQDGVESVAICFLHAYANPENERQAAGIVKQTAPGMYVTTSSDTLPVWREFERFNTTVVGAYVGPTVTHYLTELESRMRSLGYGGTLLMMLTNGLVQTIGQCLNRAVYLLDSGPAAAPSAAVYFGGLFDKKNLLSVDMGGTSFDVCLVHNAEIPTTTESWIGDQRVAIKKVDLETVGAGGGSIAQINSLGLLQVGPQSAGADPGPACLGRGEEPTVTDADLVLGYLDPHYFLGGEMELSIDLAKQAIDSVGEPMGLDTLNAAQAIFATINATMADKISEVSAKRGHDVRDFTLVAGGGAGAIHSPFIADLLSIPSVLIPQVSGLYSAFGMFAMDLGQDYARSCVARLDSVDLDTITKLFEEMENEALRNFKQIGVEANDVVLQRTAEMRHIGQFHEVETEIEGGRITRETLHNADRLFRDKHEKLYAFSMPWKGVEILTIRLKATTPKAPFQLRRLEQGGEDPSLALKHTRSCRFGALQVEETPIYAGERVVAGNVIPGPAVIEEANTTVVIPAAYRATVDEYKNFILQRI